MAAGPGDRGRKGFMTISRSFESLPEASAAIGRMDATRTETAPGTRRSLAYGIPTLERGNEKRRILQ